MSKDYLCIHYYDDGKCKYFSDDKVTSYCVKGPCGAQVLSNADRIRSMSDEELHEFLYHYGYCDICEESCSECRYHGDCERRLMDWLQQPAEEVQSTE